MISSVQRFLLFATIFLGISQFGKHFWPYFAYVSGIRVDYLSPTVYVTDILIMILAIISLPAGYTYLFIKKRRVPISLLFLIGILCLGIITAKYDLPALYAAGKILEMTFFGYMIARHILPQDFSLIAKLLSGAVIIEGVLVFIQTLNQSSVGGVWYYLGERTFSSASIGISTVSVFGHDFLRSYGSFPHPNVLAFFMITAGTFLIISYSSAHDLKLKIWYLFLFLISYMVLLSTFSRTGLMVFISVLIVLMVKKMISPVLGSLFLLAGMVFVITFLQRFGLEALYSDDISSRVDLARIAWDIISKNMLFGVGLNNFFFYQIDYQREITPVLLQPPHNIYMLMWLHTGILGFIGAFYFIIKTFLRTRDLLIKSHDAVHVLAAILFLSILVIGMSDHYFLTLQQGMLMAAVIIGLVWIPEKSNKS